MRISVPHGSEHSESSTLARVTTGWRGAICAHQYFFDDEDRQGFLEAPGNVRDEWLARRPMTPNGPLNDLKSFLILSIFEP